MSNVHVSTIPLVTIVKIAQMLTPKMNGNQERFTLYPLHFQTQPLILNCVVSYGMSHTHNGRCLNDGWVTFFQWSESYKAHIDIQKRTNASKESWTVVKLIGSRDLVAIAMAILSDVRELVAKLIATVAEIIP